MRAIVQSKNGPGKAVRVRKPAKVIEEMLALQRDHDVRILPFQDDDLPLWGNGGGRWAEELAERLHDSGLARTAVWKISCRGAREWLRERANWSGADVYDVLLSAHRA
jgi:hypothetical protein